MVDDKGPFADAIRVANLTDREINRKKEEAKNDIKPFLVREPVLVNNIEEGFVIPNYSGIKQGALKSSPTTFLTSESDPVFLSLSGSFLTAETDPVFLALSGSFLISESDPVWLAMSGSYIKNLDNFSGSTISGSAIRTIEDHTTSGSSAVVGIITHTSATPPTASNYPQGTLYIQYTA